MSDPEDIDLPIYKPPEKRIILKPAEKRIILEGAVWEVPSGKTTIAPPNSLRTGSPLKGQ